MQYRRVWFQRLVSDVLLERGDEDVVMGEVRMGCANRCLCHYRMFRCLYRIGY